MALLYIRYPAWLSPQIADGLPIRWYGIMYLVAFVVTYGLFRYEAGRIALSPTRELIDGFFTWAILGVLIGGRLFFALVLDQSGELLRHPWLIVWPFRDGRFTGIQGMSYHGALIGAATAIAVYTRMKRLNLLDWGDTLAVCAPAGYALGRLGNFINGEMYGRATSVSWAVEFPTARRFPITEQWVSDLAWANELELDRFAQMVNLPRHPSQLYEALLGGVVLWLVLWFFFRRQRPFKGALIGLHITGYGAAQFVAEYFRETSMEIGFIVNLSGGTNSQIVGGPLDLTEGQMVSLGMTIIGITLFVILRVFHQPVATVETYTE